MTVTFDGRDELRSVLKRAGFDSVGQAVASLTLFVHPTTVAESKNKALFRIIRDDENRGKILPYLAGGRVMACDNTGPSDALRWAVGGVRGKDIQFNHIYAKSSDVNIYTSLANICITPAFIAKLTDGDDEIIELLKFRVFDQFGFLPEGEDQPTKPSQYESLKWRECFPVAGNLEMLCRAKMRDGPRNRASISAKEIGWLFSNYEPDDKL